MLSMTSVTFVTKRVLQKQLFASRVRTGESGDFVCIVSF